jgi:hypothetical protein
LQQTYENKTILEEKKATGRVWGESVVRPAAALTG